MLTFEVGLLMLNLLKVQTLQVKTPRREIPYHLEGVDLTVKKDSQDHPKSSLGTSLAARESEGTP
jgi:hypothetical protein